MIPLFNAFSNISFHILIYHNIYTLSVLLFEWSNWSPWWSNWSPRWSDWSPIILFLAWYVFCSFYGGYNYYVDLLNNYIFYINIFCSYIYFTFLFFWINLLKILLNLYIFAQKTCSFLKLYMPVLWMRFYFFYIFNSPKNIFLYF